MDNKGKLLFIDDDPSLRDLTEKYFSRHGFIVFTAEDGEQGLEVFSAERPDIVLVDLRMPKVDGFAVIEKVVAESPETPVLVISGEGEMADVIQALRLGAWNYQTKPVSNLLILQHAVDQALEKARLIRENQAYQKGLETKLSTIIENFDGFVFTCDHEYRITYMNQSLIKHLGRDTTGEFCYKVIFGCDHKCAWCVDNADVENMGSHFEIQSPVNGRWYHVIQSVILDYQNDIKERQVILYDITERKKAIIELQEQEEYLRKENVRLRASLFDRYKFGNIIGKSKAMQEVYESIVNASATDAGVIIYGESGTGKELVAQAIHENSDRKEKKLVYVNCGAIPENLIESEFFGYKKGAFTGANKDKHGYMDIAAGGTLFLDEIGEIPLGMQVKLLRALEGRGYTPVGGTEVSQPDFRIIAATNRDLKELVRQGVMRQDFLYRIHIIPIILPPLRRRKEDIPLLIEHFVKQYDPAMVPPITPQVNKALLDYSWPGNVRELQNTINRFVTLKKLDFMGIDLTQPEEDVDSSFLDFEMAGRSLNEILDELEKRVLIKFFEDHNWHQGKTAQALHIDRKTLYRKMKQYNVVKPSS